MRGGDGEIDELAEMDRGDVESTQEIGPNYHVIAKSFIFPGSRLL